MIALSGVTDCYQPIERRLQLTRRCLAVLAECRNPVTIVTKNTLVTRDLDLLVELARHGAASVMISLTTLDPALRRILEPRTSPPASRLEAIRRLADAGIPVGILMAPMIPALNDHEQSLYDDLRFDRLGERVRLEQEKIAFALVKAAIREL